MSSPSDQKHLAIVPRRKFGYMLRDELAKLDSSLGVDLAFSESILENWPVREAFIFFSLLTDPDPPTWRAWFSYRIPSESRDHKAPQRNAPAYLKFLEACGDNIDSPNVFGLCEEPREKHRGSGGASLWDRACRFRELIQKHDWSDMDERTLIRSVFNPDLWILDGIDNIESSTRDLAILCDNALRILDELEEDEAFDGDISQITRQLRYSIATKEPLVTAESTLKVTTLWGAKGLTAQHVYVIGLCKEAIPGVRKSEYRGTDNDYYEEQRRLFYVTITRAKETLILSRSKKIKPGDAKQLNLHVRPPEPFYSELTMCPFLRDIMDELPDAVEGGTLL